MEACYAEGSKGGHNSYNKYLSDNSLIKTVFDKSMPPLISPR